MLKLATNENFDGDILRGYSVGNPTSTSFIRFRYQLPQRRNVSRRRVEGLTERLPLARRHDDVGLVDVLLVVRPRPSAALIHNRFQIVHLFRRHFRQRVEPNGGMSMSP